jgi:hypothetical protein
LALGAAGHGLAGHRRQLPGDGALPARWQPLDQDGSTKIARALLDLIDSRPQA